MQWEIVRTKPAGRTHGFAIPAFIHNMQYHYAPVEVYGDGLIDCWGAVDLAIFRRKLEQGWVVTEAPVGAQLSFHNLGWASVRACNWQYTTADLLKRVEAGLDLLNPRRAGLIDMGGEETERGLPDDKPFRIDAAGNEVLGDAVAVFVQAGSEFQLTAWFIYADGSSRVGPTGPLSSAKEVAERLNGGDLRTSVPDGARITLEGLGWFESQNSSWHVKPEERAREVYDMLAMLQGEQGSMRKCMVCLSGYQTDPTPENRDQLRLAYEAVPEHLRHYCGDMDSKDWPIRRILYGEQTEGVIAATSEASINCRQGEATSKADRILVVENEEIVRRIIVSMLTDADYECGGAADGLEALALLESDAGFELVLSSLMMPNVDGIALLERVKERYRDIPVVFVTAVHDIQVALQALRNGAYDYVLKPIEREQLLATVRRALENRRLQRKNDDYRTNLEALVNARTQQWKNALADLERAYDISLEIAGDALDMKNAETASHSKRVTAFAIAIARRMGLPMEAINVIARGAFLHDIGKMAIPDQILLKPSKLTEKETAIMREHCLSGHKMLKKVPFLAEAAEIAYAHHEHYDGTGYPCGLKGAEIPLGARIVAVANTLDSITSDLPYRPARSFLVARREIERWSGNQFDPEIVGVFVSIPENIWGDLRGNSNRSELR